jgi:predicted small integral membrane protein
VTLRFAKTALVFGVAVFYSFVVFNNVTDYNSNYQFIRHVLMMDSTFPGNQGMWRAINSPTTHTVFCVSIVWESVTLLLSWAGAIRRARAKGNVGSISSSEAHRHPRATMVVTS